MSNSNSAITRDLRYLNLNTPNNSVINISIGDIEAGVDRLRDKKVDKSILEVLLSLIKYDKSNN